MGAWDLNSGPFDLVLGTLLTELPFKLLTVIFSLWRYFFLSILLDHIHWK